MRNIVYVGKPLKVTKRSTTSSQLNEHNLYVDVHYKKLDLYLQEMLMLFHKTLEILLLNMISSTRDPFDININRKLI